MGRERFLKDKDLSNLKEKTKNQTYKSFTIETRDEKVKKGRTGDALALRGDEGRDKLRKAAGRRKWP